MTIADEGAARHILSHINYYRLRAYWLPFEVPPAEQTLLGEHKFVLGTEFQQAVRLYLFDRELRLLLLEAIECIEISLRTRWAQVVAERHGAHAHLDAALFSDGRMYAGCIEHLHEELARSKETFVQHYQRKYTDPETPPIWAIAELLTLGQLSKWLNNLKRREDRQDVAYQFGLDEKVVCAFAHHLTHVRNLCAHHCRVWNRRLTLTMTIPKRPAELAQQFQPDTRRIYNTLVMLAWFVAKASPGSTWPTRLVGRLSQLTPQEIGSMGAPTDWAHRKPWLNPPSLVR